MKKLLIAVNSSILSQSLYDALYNEFDIVCCQDGLETVAWLKDFQPDFMVLDLMLSGMDGISVMRIMRDIGLKTCVVALASVCSDYVLAAMEQTKASYLLRMPISAQQIASSIMDLAAWQTEENADNRRIREILASLGFRLSTSGYKITATALSVLLQNPHYALTAGLYPAVADKIGGSSTQVEKAIRSSIESAWKNRNEQIWQLYFAVGKNGFVSKPTNSDFLFRIVHCLSDNAAWENEQDIICKIC